MYPKSILHFPVRKDSNNEEVSRGRLEMLNFHNAIFVVKPHPYDYSNDLLSLTENLNQFFVANPNDIDSVDLMNIASIVVTDYSGILVDWLILGKPTICYTYDFEEYWKNRGSPLFDYNEVFGM